MKDWLHGFGFSVAEREKRYRNERVGSWGVGRGADAMFIDKWGFGGGGRGQMLDINTCKVRKR